MTPNANKNAEKGDLLLVGVSNGRATMENCQIFRKLNVWLPYIPTIAKLDIYSGK